ncbi:hypothetical protein T492DRAFT_939856 [Pavlovales sp. CCMP2436]|nr:hypothetical protein T492DRAFT_939856 [Pavlovales sp. CCMP2436]
MALISANQWGFRRRARRWDAAVTRGVGSAAICLRSMAGAPMPRKNACAAPGRARGGHASCVLGSALAAPSLAPS